MLIGQRLREIRDAKYLSQDDIERSTGLVRPYISRVENGHTVPSVETLQKWAAALGMQFIRCCTKVKNGPNRRRLRAKLINKLVMDKIQRLDGVRETNTHIAID